MEIQRRRSKESGNGRIIGAPPRFPPILSRADFTLRGESLAEVEESRGNISGGNLVGEKEMRWKNEIRVVLRYRQYFFRDIDFN